MCCCSEQLQLEGVDWRHFLCDRNHHELSLSLRWQRMQSCLETFCFFNICNNPDGGGDKCFSECPHVLDEDLRILGEFCSISQTERHSEFGRYGLIYKKQ